LTTSGSVDFSVSRDNTVEFALRKLGIMSAADTSSSSSFTSHLAPFAIALNMMIKQWQADSDFAPGLKVWSRKRATLFLQKSQNVYSLGPLASSGDKWATSYVSTTLSGAEAAGQTALSVTSITGISSADVIGIVLDSGVVHWTTVNGAPGAGVVTATVALPTAAASGNRVFAYTPSLQARRPLSILSCVLRSADGTNDTPIPSFRSIQAYMELPNKTATATPGGYLYEAQLLNGMFYIDGYPSDTRETLYMVYLSPIEDFDASADTPDFPQHWYLPLGLGLALLMAPDYGKMSRMPAIKELLTSALAMAKNVDPEVSDAYFQCDADQ
jgi:hypothetical protein